MKRRAILLIGAATIISSLAAGPTVTVDASYPSGKVSPMLYGLMTEEINYSYDGGLYAELIRNRALRPDLSVERTVLNRLRDVVAGNLFHTGQISNRASHLQNAVVSSGTEIQVSHCEFQ